MGEVGHIRYFTGSALLWLSGTVVGVAGANKIFQRPSITPVGWYGCGRGRAHKYFTEPALLWLAVKVMNEVGPTRYFTKPALLCLAVMVMAEVGHIRYFMERALPWLAGTVIGEGWVHNIFQGRSVTVDG